MFSGIDHKVKRIAKMSLHSVDGTLISFNPMVGDKEKPIQKGYALVSTGSLTSAGLWPGWAASRALPHAEAKLWLGCSVLRLGPLALLAAVGREPLTSHSG